jgi:hypothetical protein
MSLAFSRDSQRLDGPDGDHGEPTAPKEQRDPAGQIVHSIKRRDSERNDRDGSSVSGSGVYGPTESRVAAWTY